MNRSDGSTAAYYELPKDCTELQHLISHRDMNAQIGEIFRACYRYGIASHSDKLRDAKKMRFYAQAEIERLERLLHFDRRDFEPASAIDDDSDRQQLIQQSGEMAEEVYAAVDNKPSWDSAPEWACWLGQAKNGNWEWYQDKPTARYEFWDHPTKGEYAFRCGRENPNWQLTLEQRPQKDA